MSNIDDVDRLRTAWCKPCKRSTHYAPVGKTKDYIACTNCGAIYFPMTSDQVGVWNQLKGIQNARPKK